MCTVRTGTRAFEVVHSLSKRHCQRPKTEQGDRVDEITTNQRNAESDPQPTALVSASLMRPPGTQQSQPQPRCSQMTNGELHQARDVISMRINLARRCAGRSYFAYECAMRDRCHI